MKNAVEAYFFCDIMEGTVAQVFVKLERFGSHGMPQIAVHHFLIVENE